ncbi:MAG: Mut7-C RNAse domain-containing protein [Deltaproteobacteria bacterium]|nr:Mut7-C RNAse domain-containing protein [Deltaproteobacteria bacterium]
MKFIADRMLGRLARWLRIIGQDVTYGPHLTGAGLLRAARADGRIILTRDRRVARRNPPEYIFIQSDRFREQLRQVVQAFGLDPLQDAFTRCVDCNTLLQPISKEKVEEKVPPYVFSTQEKFSTCPKCRRIYWPATHEQKMLEELRALDVEAPGSGNKFGPPS